ncbi:C6 transcription factor [Cordyceps militaris]|uniref:C6 transcription factor n=1 Tax=Cordyceps militaris TaxID=73501 RepID=A0A2H4S589_CORMI|nr:C6 transcription factor [Cordyceps militaris]
MDYMHVGELDIDDNEPPNRERERLWDNMPGPPFPSDKTWAPPATLNSAHSSQASPPSGLTTSGTNNDRISYSGASSCEGSWASSTTDHDQAERDLNWDEWEEGSDSAPIKPKNEPVDDEDITMSEVKIPTLASPEKSIVAPGQKRGRGRPRKNPIPAPTNGTKVTKGRSKTGCITCRKRKKKCDEAKPGCMNCEKNSVLCEGYNEKQIWKSGKDRDQVLPGRTNREAFPSVTLPTLVQGLDTPEDKIFLRHYINRLSNVLTVEPKSHNAFKDILLTLATSQPGLLHSILSISSLHIDLDTPYGEGILQINPAVTKESLRQRSNYHTTEARNYLYGAFEKSELLDKDSSEYHLVLAALYGQMLCLVVRTLIEGNPRGEHRVHLKAYQKLIRESPPESTQLHTFITEFFQYHICADDLLWHPETDSTRLSLEETGSTPHDHTSRLVGVTDGLFCHLRDITTLRNEIRSRLAGAKDQPAVSYAEIFKANDITMALQSWSPNWPRSDNRVRVGELYKLTLWIYSFRTIYPPAASNADFLLGGSSLLSYMQERRSSVASSGQLSNGCSEDKHPFEQKISCSPNSSRTSSIHEEDGLPTPAPTHGTSSSRPPSPPPSRRPSQDDKRVTTSILDALSILETFEPNDQCQTLLLIPCLLIGTSCFDAALRPRIQAAVQAVREYTGLRNADRVQEVLNATWALMDAGDWVAVWDWQTVARHKGLDFCT